MNTAKEKTCEDRVLAAAASRLNDIHAMLAPCEADFYLGDDGTLDTVILCGGENVARFSSDYVADYRDDSGTLDWESFVNDHVDEWTEYQRDRFAEHGLSFEWKDGRDEWSSGFHAFVLSTGGPHEEIRFFSDASGHVYKITFYLADWFDSASVDVTDWDAARMLCADFKDCGMFDTTGERERPETMGTAL